MIPPVTTCSFSRTHRLIPTRYSAEGTVLADLADTPDEIEALVELDGSTNARLLGDSGLLPGIGVHELLFGVPYAHIVNASFTHAGPHGGRFNSGVRGAWYASLSLETSFREVAWHKIAQLEEVQWPDDEISSYDDYLADFEAEFHDLRGRLPAVEPYLRPGPVPACYVQPQQLAADLLQHGSSGIVYPSVRHARGTCVVCFRPALVYHVRRDRQYEFTLHAGRPFTSSQARPVQ